jgi:hypothetical protein
VGWESGLIAVRLYAFGCGLSISVVADTDMIHPLAVRMAEALRVRTVWPPNASRITRAAILEREHRRADIGCQNRADLARRAAASGACARIMAATVQARRVSAQWVCGNDRVNKNSFLRARAPHSQNQIVRLVRGSTSVDHDQSELRS